MFKKTWLSAAALGCALSLAAPLTALAHDRDDYRYRNNGYRYDWNRGHSSNRWNHDGHDYRGSNFKGYDNRGSYQGPGRQQFSGNQGNRIQTGNRVPTSPFDPANNQPAPSQNQNQPGVTFGPNDGSNNGGRSGQWNGASSGSSNRGGGSYQGGSNFGRR